MNYPKYYIYKLTFASGATYIGQHTQKEEKDGYITSSKYFRKNIKKDPLVKREILLYVKDKETLDIMETLCIRADMCDNEKNVNGNYGNWDYRFNFKRQHHNEEFKQKTSEQFKELWKNKDYRDKMLSAHLGRKNTDEIKKRMSTSALASWTDERRQKAIESGNYSHPHSEETKELLGKQKIGNILINNGKREKFVKNADPYLSNGWVLGKLHKVSDETKKKMSEAAKRRKCNTTGKIKIHKGDIGKFIAKEDLQSWLDKGWKKGVSEKRAALLKAYGFKPKAI